jgi:MSHA biogenesis protein MshK
MKKRFQVQSSKFKVRGSKFPNLEPGTWNLERAAAWLLGAVLLLIPAAAAAQVMNDPTRPPSGQATADPDVAGDAGGGGLVLQSVMISPTVKAAIISGAMVKLGEKYGDAVLVKVAENEVVLKSGDGSQVLKLYPGVEKRDIAPVVAKTTPRKSKARRSRTVSTAPGSAATR